MIKYVEPYLTSDVILSLFAEKHSRPESDIEIYFESHNGGKYWRAAMKQLFSDGLITSDSANQSWFVITGEGSQLYSNGGYKQRFEREEEAENYKTKFEQASLKNLELQNQLAKYDKLPRKYWWVITAILIVASWVISKYT